MLISQISFMPEIALRNWDCEGITPPCKKDALQLPGFCQTKYLVTHFARKKDRKKLLK